MDIMKLPSEPAQTLKLCQEAGLSDRETRIVIEKNYPQPRVIKITNKPKTYAELANEFGLSVEGVRFIEKKALVKLKNSIHQD